MTLQTHPPIVAFDGYFGRPRCPQCGDMVFAPTATEFAGEGRIQHHWSCEMCGQEFGTAVEVPVAA